MTDPCTALKFHTRCANNSLELVQSTQQISHRKISVQPACFSIDSLKSNATTSQISQVAQDTSKGQNKVRPEEKRREIMRQS